MYVNNEGLSQFFNRLVMTGDNGIRLNPAFIKHPDADFSHSICPDCTKKLYPDFDV